MKHRVFFYLKYILYWIGIQFFFRLIFLLFYGHLVEDLSFRNAALTFVHGFRLDLSLTGYILIIPTLIIAIFSLFKKDLTRKIIHIYSAVILFIVILSYMTNLVVYQFWNYPIDKSMFDYVGSPREWLANTKTINFLLSLVIFFLLFTGLYFILKKWITNSIRELKPGWPSFGLFIFLLPSLIVPIRGGTGIATLNTGSAYFHKTEILNHCAVNPVWNLFYSISESNRMNTRYNFVSEEEAKLVHDTLYQDKRISPSLLNNPRPNVVIIMMESFGADIIAELGGNPEVTPEFNSLTDKGIFFKNFYSTGPMTDRALSGVLSGYPALPGICIIHYEKKTQTIPFISKDLRSAGYNTTFIYGGDINFAHMKSYVITAGFDRIISNNDNHFSSSIQRSKWGVPDEYTFERLFQECGSSETPFFIFCLTLSNHNPFDVPMEPVFPGSGYEEQFFNAAYYSDKCLGEFISKARNTDWYKNTLLIILGDHGTRIGNTNEFDFNRFNIPMLWLGGAITNKGTYIDSYGSQTDLPNILLSQLDLPVYQYKFSRNLFDSESPSFAFYSFQNGFGMKSDSLYLVYHLPTNQFKIEIGSEAPLWRKKGLAYLQYISSDFISR
jgi:phosphoglycerol transferase MdoB-like AlkP superfamily enzyme